MKWVCGGTFVIAVAALFVALGSHSNTADPATNTSEYVALQNNLYPNGYSPAIGTRAAQPRFGVSSGKPDDGWSQGGRASVTNTTGRWAA